MADLFIPNTVWNWVRDATFLEFILCMPVILLGLTPLRNGEVSPQHLQEQSALVVVKYIYG